MSPSPSPASSSSVRPGENTIELSLQDMDQLFNTMDPSPFHQKDLDHNAEEFIVSWARDTHCMSRSDWWCTCRDPHQTRTLT
jgi:hypothetical protein